jgi:hypothetical protein
MGVLPGVVMAIALVAAAPAPFELDLARTPMLLDDVVTQFSTACNESPRVPVRVMSGEDEFEVRFECDRIQADRPDAIRAELLHGVADLHDARERADRVVAVDRALPRADRVGYVRDWMVWSFAGRDPETCRRARQPRTIRTSMAQAAASNRETPERWTMVEAVLLAGACPDRLEDLYENVRRVGEPEAARAVERRIERALRAK